MEEKLQLPLFFDPNKNVLLFTIMLMAGITYFDFRILLRISILQLREHYFCIFVVSCP